MSCLSLGEHRADKPLEQVDRLIGHGGAEIEGNGGQGGVAALPFVSSEMLGRRPSSLPGELHKTALMHAMPARGVVADCPDMVQAFDEAEHRGRLCRLRHLPQPAEPALAGFRPALCQRIQPSPLVGRQAIGQSSLDLPPCPKAKTNTEAFQAPRCWDDNPAPAALLHGQLGQMEEAIVLDGMRMEGFGKFGRSMFPEGAELQPVRNPPMGTVLMLSSSADHFSDLRGHSYERSYDGIWFTGRGFDGPGAAAPVERRAEAGDCRGTGALGILWGCGCAAIRDLDGSFVHMAPTGSRVAVAVSTNGARLHAGGGRAEG